MSDLFQQTLDNDPVIVDENKDYLNELVGPGKKYADQQALAKSRIEADLFIERLKAENSGIRNELHSRVKMEEFLNRLSDLERQKLNTNQQSLDADQDPPVQAKDEGGKLTPEDVLKLMDQRDHKRKADENIGKVMNKLQEAYGPNYASKLKQVTNSLGLSNEHVNNLAATSPEALYKVLGLEQKTDIFNPAPLRTQINTQGFKPSVSGERDWDYYEKIRKEDVKRYWTPAIQNQLHSDAMRLGDAFKK